MFYAPVRPLDCKIWGRGFYASGAYCQMLVTERVLNFPPPPPIHLRSKQSAAWNITLLLLLLAASLLLLDHALSLSNVPRFCFTSQIFCWIYLHAKSALIVTKFTFTYFSEFLIFFWISTIFQIFSILPNSNSHFSPTMGLHIFYCFASLFFTYSPLNGPFSTSTSWRQISGMSLLCLLCFV